VGAVKAASRRERREEPEMVEKKDKPGDNSWYWYFKGLAEASVDLSEGLPVLIQPLVRLLFALILTILSIFLIPWFIFRHIFPAKQKENAYFNARTELETSWIEDSPETALERMRDLTNDLKSQEMKLHHGKGVQVQPFGVFKWWDYYHLVDLLYHFETRLGHYQAASDLCDEFLEPYVDKKEKISPLIEKWFVKKARAIHALQGSLAAQEFLMPYVDHDKEESYLRDYFLELRESAD
jgi:hypothetical protein